MRILFESFCETESGPVLAHNFAVGLKIMDIKVFLGITFKEIYDKFVKWLYSRGLNVKYLKAD